MENRIQINGVWYVRENIAPEIDIREDITFFKGCLYENNKYFFEATVIDSPHYDVVDIKFIDKREKSWKEQHWDSSAWLRGVYNNDPESLAHLEETNLCDEGVKIFKQFLGVLINDKKWL